MRRKQEQQLNRVEQSNRVAFSGLYACLKEIDELFDLHIYDDGSIDDEISMGDDFIKSYFDDINFYVEQLKSAIENEDIDDINHSLVYLRTLSENVSFDFEELTNNIDKVWLSNKQKSP